MVRTFPYDTLGYAIEVDDAGLVLSAQLVEPAEEPKLHGVTPVHHLFFYTSPEERDAAWSEISSTLASVDARDHVGLALDHPLLHAVGTSSVTPPSRRAA
jgi:hypothetical protein